MKSRRKPLKRTEIRRVTPLRRSAPPPSSGPVKPRKRAAQSREEKHAREAVRIRSGGRCELECLEQATEWHHRRFRSQGGKWSPANGLHLCSSHHQWITEHPTASYARGWSVRSTVDPQVMPVQRRGEWVWLRDCGDVVPLDMLDITEWVKVS